MKTLKTNADVDVAIGATTKEFAKQFLFEELPLLTHCIYDHVVSARHDLLNVFEPIQQKVVDGYVPAGWSLTEEDRDTIRVVLGKIARNKYALTSVLENFYQQRHTRVAEVLSSVCNDAKQQQLSTILLDHIQGALDRLFQKKLVVVLSDEEYYGEEGAFFDLTQDGIRTVLEKHYPEVLDLNSSLVVAEVEKLIDSLIEIKELPDQEVVVVRYRAGAKLQERLLG